MGQALGKDTEAGNFGLGGRSGEWGKCERV